MASSLTPSELKEAEKLYHGWRLTDGEWDPTLLTWEAQELIDANAGKPDPFYWPPEHVAVHRYVEQMEPAPPDPELTAIVQRIIDEEREAADDWEEVSCFSLDEVRETMQRHMVDGKPTVYSMRLLVDYLHLLDIREQRGGYEWGIIPH